MCLEQNILNGNYQYVDFGIIFFYKEISFITNTHTRVCIYTYIYVCVCVYICIYGERWEGGRKRRREGERGKEQAGIWRSEWSIVAFERMNESEC